MMQGCAFLTLFQSVSLTWLSEKQYHSWPLRVQATQCPPRDVPPCTTMPQISYSCWPGVMEWPLMSRQGGTRTMPLFLLPLLLKRLRDTTRTLGGRLMQNLRKALAESQFQQWKQLFLVKFQGAKKASRKLSVSLSSGYSYPSSPISSGEILPQGRTAFLAEDLPISTGMSRVKSDRQLTFSHSRHSSRLARWNPKVTSVRLLYLCYPFWSSPFSTMMVFSPSISALSSTPISSCASCWPICRYMPLLLHTHPKRPLGTSWDCLLRRNLRNWRLTSRLVEMSPRSKEWQPRWQASVAQRHWRVELKKQVLPRLVSPNTARPQDYSLTCYSFRCLNWSTVFLSYGFTSHSSGFFSSFFFFLGSGGSTGSLVSIPWASSTILSCDSITFSILLLLCQSGSILAMAQVREASHLKQQMERSLRRQTSGCLVPQLCWREQLLEVGPDSSHRDSPQLRQRSSGASSCFLLPVQRAGKRVMQLPIFQSLRVRRCQHSGINKNYSLSKRLTFPIEFANYSRDHHRRLIHSPLIFQVT